MLASMSLHIRLEFSVLPMQFPALSLLIPSRNPFLWGSTAPALFQCLPETNCSGGPARGCSHQTPPRQRLCTDESGWMALVGSLQLRTFCDPVRDPLQPCLAGFLPGGLSPGAEGRSGLSGGSGGAGSGPRPPGASQQPAASERREGPGAAEGGGERGGPRGRRAGEAGPRSGPRRAVPGGAGAGPRRGRGGGGPAAGAPAGGTGRLPRAPPSRAAALSPPAPMLLSGAAGSERGGCSGGAGAGGAPQCVGTMARWLREHLGFRSARPAPPAPPKPDYRAGPPPQPPLPPGGAAEPLAAAQPDIVAAYRLQKERDFEDPYSGPPPAATAAAPDGPRYVSPKHRLIKVEAVEKVPASPPPPPAVPAPPSSPPAGPEPPDEPPQEVSDRTRGSRCSPRDIPPLAMPRVTAADPRPLP